MAFWESFRRRALVLASNSATVICFSYFFIIINWHFMPPA
jgi:hypothetical protein